MSKKLVRALRQALPLLPDPDPQDLEIRKSARVGKKSPLSPEQWAQVAEWRGQGNRKRPWREVAELVAKEFGIRYVSSALARGYGAHQVAGNHDK